jgi:hypothetical protein
MAFPILLPCNEKARLIGRAFLLNYFCCWLFEWA